MAWTVFNHRNVDDIFINNTYNDNYFPRISHYSLPMIRIEDCKFRGNTIAVDKDQANEPNRGIQFAAV